MFAARPWHLTTSIIIPRAPEELFPFFADASNLGRITPPELRFTIRTQLPVEMRPGTLIDYTIGVWGVPMRWRTLISCWEPNVRFIDEQLAGPYARWVHEHRFTPVAGGTRMDDHVTFELPVAPLGDFAAPIVRRMLRRIFAYRQAKVAHLMAPGTDGVPRSPIVIARTPRSTGEGLPAPA